MYYKLLKALGFAIYCEQYFYISKKDDTHFKVTAKSGFSAIVQIADNTMFVDILDDDKKNVAYYCTPFSNTLLTVENFVIKNIQENILFKFPRNDLIDYLRTYNTLFKEVRNLHLPFTWLDKDNDIHDDDLNLFNDGYFYKHTVYNKTHYSHVYFKKKKVIKNIDRYSFYAKSLRSCGKNEASHSYLIGDTVFNLCNSYKFMQSTADSSLSHYSFDSSDMLYGINNQLNKHYQIYEDNIDLNKVAVLKRKNKDYCLITKNKRKITLSYLTDFNIRYAVLEKDPSYSSERAEFKGEEVPVYRYKNTKKVTYTYYNGQISSTSRFFSVDDAIEHEMSISNKLMNNLETLRLKYPSEQLIHKLQDLGISCENPLNPDDLTVLEMFEI